MLVLGSARYMLVPVECQLDNLRVMVGRPSMTVMGPADVHSDTEGQGPRACDSCQGQQCRDRPRYKLHARNVLIEHRFVKGRKEVRARDVSERLCGSGWARGAAAPRNVPSSTPGRAASAIWESPWTLR